MSNSEKKRSIDPDKLKAFATNAVTEGYKTETEARLPIASDISVEEAREWANEGSRL